MFWTICHRQAVRAHSPLSASIRGKSGEGNHRRAHRTQLFGSEPKSILKNWKQVSSNLNTKIKNFHPMKYTVTNCRRHGDPARHVWKALLAFKVERKISLQSPAIQACAQPAFQHSADCSYGSAHMANSSYSGLFTKRRVHRLFIMQTVVKLSH